MTDRIERMMGGAGADTPGHSSELRPPAPRARKPTQPEATALSLEQSLLRLEATAREAGQDLQYGVQSVDGADMVVITRRQDAVVMRRMAVAEAIRLATLLAGGTGGLFEGTL